MILFSPSYMAIELSLEDLIMFGLGSGLHTWRETHATGILSFKYSAGNADNWECEFCALRREHGQRGICVLGVAPGTLTIGKASFKVLRREHWRLGICL